MTGKNMKRKIAAMLCMAMMSGCMPFSTLAEAIVPPAQEDGAVLSAPQYAKIQASAETDGNSIIVYASGMSNPVICVTLDGEITQNMNGTRHTFTDVENGEHTVQVRYNAPDAAAFASDVIVVTVHSEPAAPVTEAIIPEPAAPIAEEIVIEPAAQAAGTPAAEVIEIIEVSETAGQTQETEQAMPLTLEIAPIIGGTMPEIQTNTAVPENVVQAEPAKAQTEQLESVIEKAPETLTIPDTAQAVIPASPDLSAANTMQAETAEPITPAAPAADADGGEEDEPVYSAIKAQITTGEDSITVTIIESSSEAMYVAVGEDWKEGLYKGDSATFSGLEPGEYDVEVDYLDGTNVFRDSAVIEETPTDPVTPPAEGDADEDADQDEGEDSGVDAIIPPASGDTDDSGDSGVDAIVPPASGDTDNSGDSGVDAIVPPASGDTDASQDSSSGNDPQSVKTFTILPVITDGTISVVIDGASDREVEVMLLDENGSRLTLSSIIGSGLVTLGKFSSGTYTVRAQYVTPVQTADGGYDFKTVTAKAVVEAGITADPVPTEPVEIKAKAETGKDYVIVTVTDSADAEMYAALGSFEPRIITKGGSVRFDGLEAGASYDLEIDYVNPIQGASPYRTTVTIEEAAKLGTIKITGVTPGTNMLTVSGTATAGEQLMITTTPAAAGDVYAVSDSKGTFSVQIACAANTYTAVTAKYVSDSTISATASGSWTVAAPAVKPTLTVDAVDTTSTTVIAKTTAGVVVEIKTGDYTQKVIADDGGIVRFSLPHTYAAGTVFTFTVYYGADNSLSFAQSITVSAVPYLGTLEYGDVGDAVQKLTERLEALGYPVQKTSRYGSTVREAVRLFQLANGLDDDGIAGPKTQRALFSVSAIAYGSDKYPTLVRGDRGYALIYTLQQRLKDLGYYTIKVDGIFGSGTQRAVREFQRVNGLSVTGKADNATQTLLYSSSAKPASQGVSGEYTTLSRSGKYKSKVVPLQRRLKALGYYGGSIDGYFGSQTYRAVRNFQSRNGLTVTGVADPYTQQVLYSSSARAASGSSSSSSSSSGYRLLYWGCRGDAVRKLQQALIDAGYKKLVRTADGIFGQWTYDAVRAYQKDKGLAVDGIAGKNTQNALYGTSY